jgi:glyoxylase-like metal-dependent hydrolase (beta-lactamase superfamily II)
MISSQAIRRILLGHFTIPDDGDPRAGEKMVVCAYLIHHPDGLVLFDTGIGSGDEEFETFYNPVRRSLDDALASVGVGVGDVRIVANCHLHADHCGGNPRFGGTPIFAQSAEVESARGEDYTIPALVEFPNARYELHDGEADVASGIRIVPTPGHTVGHQSLVVETTEGRIVLAGQAVGNASDYARAQYAWQLRRGGSPEPVTYPDWVARFQELDPVRILFAHDTCVWERPDPG